MPIGATFFEKNDVKYGKTKEGKRYIKMTHYKHYILAALVTAAMAGLSGAGSVQAVDAVSSATHPAPAPQYRQAQTTKDTTKAATVKDAAAKAGNTTKQTVYDLSLDTKTYTTQTHKVNGQDVTYRAFENRVYVKHPVDVQYQTINIYVPEAYYQNGTINGYTAKTAPVFLPNSIGGYMPGEAATPGTDRMHGGDNAALVALSRGYIVAAPGARGRTLQDANGKYTGKAPAAIVDLKAAVRYLRYNAHRLPGDMNKIISDGTSAGGAMSALLAASGDAKAYRPYLKALGAADERDDIFAAAVYCPIMNLEHADMAYEWVFNGVNTYHQRAMGGFMPAFLKVGNKILPMGPGPVMLGTDGKPLQANNRPANAPEETTTATEMTMAQISASAQLKQAFPAYVNSLGLKDAAGTPLTLDEQGNGTFKEYIKSVYKASAQAALDAGKDLSKTTWLTITNGKVTDVDMAAYAKAATRMKATPAFDAFNLSSAETDEFGNATTQARHFTTFSQNHTTVPATMADADTIAMMNPMTYIGTNDACTAQHWRIRHGAIDRDTALPIPAILALKLQNSGKSVNFASPWGKGHDGDYDLKALFDWIDGICKTGK